MGSDAILWYEPVQEILHNAETATTADGKTLKLEGKYASVVLQVTGTMTSSDINFEGNIDGKSWVPLVGINVGDGSVATKTGSNTGIWAIPVAGINYFRARKSGTGSSAITVTAVATSAPAVQVGTVSSQ